jgi:hypothetical protein
MGKLMIDGKIKGKEGVRISDIIASRDNVLAVTNKRFLLTCPSAHWTVDSTTDR